MNPECEGDRKYRNYYRYYDTPDGCDVKRKIMVTTRYGIVTGLVISAYDVLMYSHAVQLGHIMKRYMYHTVPLALAGATFAAVTNGVMHARQIDDHLNYFIGGVASGPILCTYLRFGAWSVPGTLLLGVFAMIKKKAVEEGWEFFPDFPDHMNTIRSWRHDYTLSKDPRDEMIHTCIPPI